MQYDQNTEKIAVSVLVLTYNHKDYIRECLDSIISQETDFCFEILIHDDASDDGTADIVREYADRYPDMVVPILQKDNKYSAGVFVIDEILLPIARGRYIAYLEGDDLWCDTQKLQKQYDYMESHHECSMCGHNTIVRDMRGTMEDQLFFGWDNIHTMTDEEVFLEWDVHSSSYFVRREFASTPLIEQSTWFFDYAQLTTRFAKGTIDLLPDVMSIYRFARDESITANHENSVDTGHMVEDDRIEYLKKYSETYSHKYDGVILQRITAHEDRKALSTLSHELVEIASSGDWKEIVSRISKHIDGDSRLVVLSKCIEEENDPNHHLAIQIMELLRKLTK